MKALFDTCEEAHPGKPSTNYRYDQGCRGEECTRLKAIKGAAELVVKRSKRVPRAPEVALEDQNAECRRRHPHKKSSPYHYTMGCRGSSCVKAKSDSARRSRDRALVASGKPPANTGARHKAAVEREQAKRVQTKDKSAAKPLTMRASSEMLKARTYVSTPDNDCGTPLANESYCRRLWPCAIHDKSPE